MPSRSRSPRWPSARWRVDLAGSVAVSSATRASISGGRSSSGKSIAASRCASRREQPLGPAAVKAAQIAVELAQGLAALRFGLGGGEIGHRLGLGQVELAVEKGAAGEFAGLGEPQAVPAQRRP